MRQVLVDAVAQVVRGRPDSLLRTDDDDAVPDLQLLIVPDDPGLPVLRR